MAVRSPCCEIRRVHRYQPSQSRSIEAYGQDCFAAYRPSTNQRMSSRCIQMRRDGNVAFHTPMSSMLASQRCCTCSGSIMPALRHTTSCRKHDEGFASRDHVRRHQYSDGGLVVLSAFLSAPLQSQPPLLSLLLGCTYN